MWILDLNQLSARSWESSICRRIDRVTIPSDQYTKIIIINTPINLRVFPCSDLLWSFGPQSGKIPELTLGKDPTSTTTVGKPAKSLCFEIRSGPPASTDVSCMQSTHAHAHSALAVILSHAATQKHPYLAPQNGHLRGRGCYMRHTERPSGHRPRPLMRSRFKVRRASALELSPTICFLDSTRRATISRGHLGGRCDYPALPVRQSGSRGMRGRVWGDHWPRQALKTRRHWPPRPSKPFSDLFP